MRPARPARCVADDWLIRWMFSDGRPVQGESTATRASPLSITAVTPSMVIELSATLVDKNYFSPIGAHDGAVLLCGRQIAMQGNHQ